MFNNFFKFFSVVFLLVVFAYTQNSFAQLSGTKTIPGDYATIDAAIIDLNTQGVGAGGVTFNIAAGYTETAPAGGYLLGSATLNASTSASNPLVFQKSGTGANPLITAFTPGASTTVDGIWKIQGTDYVTIDGIDLQENPSNTTATELMEWGYALVKLNNAAPFDGCQYVTIKNCSISLSNVNTSSVGIYAGNHIATATTALTITDPSDAMNNGKFFSNNITGAYTGIRLAGYNNTTSPYALYDQNNEVGVGGANTVTNYGGGSATAYGFYAIYQNNLKVANNTFNGSGTSTLYGIFTSTGTSSNVDIYNNTVTVAGGGTASAVNGINNAMGSTAAGNTVNIYGNTIQNCTYSTATSAAFYSIYNTASAENVNIYDNVISGNTVAGTGSFYGLYSGACTNLNIYGNTVSDNTKTGASGFMYLTYASTAIVNFYENDIFNNTIPSSSGTTSIYIYGYYNFGSPTVENLHDNNIYNNTVGGTNNNASSYNDGIYTNTTAAAEKNIYNNNIYGLTAASGLVNGIRTNLGTNHIYKNNIYNLTNNTTSTTAATVNGITMASGVAVYAYNNFISDLQAPQSASTDAVRGINITSTTASSNIGLYYNTIYLDAASTGANFGSSGIFHTASATATTASLDMRNNIVVNNSTANGTGLTVTYRRSSTALNNYNSLSNNNDFYAGTPSASNLIFYDGTNSDQTLATYKTRVAPRDAASFTENPPFINVSTTPYNLHMNTAVATQTESGGTPVTTPVAITDDFDGNTRNATTPDVGADEFNGILLDLNPPVISYTPLLNTTSTSARTLTASISDAGSGVPTAGIGLPVLYWKKNFNGVWTGATATYLSGNNYQFSFGAGVAADDTVFYYVAAQDGAGTPNVTCYPLAGAGGFTANPPAAGTPPTNPSSYFIVAQAPLAGDYTIGTTLFNQVTGHNIYFQQVVTKVLKEVEVPVQEDLKQNEKDKELKSLENHTSANLKTTKQMMEVEEISWIPMENNMPYTGDLYVKKADNPEYTYPEGTNGIYATITAAVADLNLRGVSAAVNFLLTDATYPSETYPITVKITNAALPTSVNKVTIKPNTGVTASISGSAASTQIFKILNSYVNIDGSNSGGTDRSLTIQNTSTTSPNVIVIGSTGTTPIVGNSVKNCIIINGVNTSSALIITDGTAPGTAGYFNNITVQNNSFQLAYIAMYCNAVVAAGNGSGLTITGNDINTSGANAVSGVGVYVQGVDGATVTNNNIANFYTSIGANRYGIWLASGTVNSTVTGNNVGNLTSTVAYYPMGIVATSGAANSNITISGNIIHDLSHTSSGDAVAGIVVSGASGGIKVTKNYISNISNMYSGGYGAWGISLSSSLAASNIEVSNNMVSNVVAYGYASILYENGIGIFVNSGGGYNIYYNSVNLYTNQTSGVSMSMYLTSSVVSVDARNNIFVNSNTTNSNYCVYSGAPNTVFTDINYNDYYAASVTNGYVGYLGAAQQSLAAWQTATGKDANSISADPKFESNTDLHIQTQYNIVDGKAQPIASVLTDIDGDTRNATTPDIGGDEYTFAPPSVLDPTGVTATAISGNQIDIAFTPNANNNNVVIVYNLTGTFTAPTGTPTVGQPLAGGEVIAITTTSPYSHTSLNQLTHYYYKLFSYNGTDYSPGVSADATTPCAPISTFPWTESFEGVTIPAFPNCWFKENGDWVTTNNGNSTYDADARTGTQFLRESYSAVDEYMWTPGFQLNAGTSYDFSFWWAGDTYSGWTGDVFMNTSQISTGATQVGTSFVTSGTTTTKTYQQFLYSFTPSSSGTYYFAIRVNASATPWYLSFDDFRFDLTPAGPVFSVNPDNWNFGTVFAGSSSATKNFVVSNIGAGTLTLNGASLTGADADQFNLEAKTYPLNIAPGATDTIKVTFTPTTGGTKNASLEVTHNAAGTPSVIPLTGKALPAGILYEDFTGTTFPPAGWLAFNNDGGTSNWVRSTLKYNSAPASAMSSYESSGIRNNDWLISPKVTVASSDSISFFISAYSASYPETMVLKVGSSPNPNGSWTTIDSITTNLTTWQRKAYSLSAFAGQDVYIAFVNRSQDQFYLFLDDVMGPIKYVTQNDIGLTAYSQPTTESTFFTGVSRDLAKKDPKIGMQKLSISLIQEVKNKTNGGPIDFKVIVQNYGAATQNSYQIGWQIDNNVQTSVNNTKALAPGASDTLTLTWAAPVAGIHTSRAWTILAGDENPMNDTSATISFYAVPDNSVFLEGFEDATFPPTGWLDIDADGSGISWFQGNPAVFSALTGFGYAGSNFQGANSSGVIDQWLITPNTGSASTDTDSLVFYIRTPNGSMWPDSVQILVSTTGTNISDFTTMLGYFEVPMNDQWNRFAYVLPNSANRYIAFRYLIYDADVNSNYIGLDLVEIQRHTSTPSTFQLSVNITDGWNMVSVPGTNPDGMSVDTWWQYRDPLATVYKWANGANTPVTTTVPTEGYWMFHSGTRTYNTGDEWPAGGIQIVSHDPIPVTTGWNMFGVYEQSVPTANLSTTPANLIVAGTVYSWTGSYTNPTNLDPGYGYWVYVSGSGVINPPSALKGGGGDAVLGKEISKDWGRIIISDSQGKSYTLYSVKGEVDLTHYLLPPLPPAGSFDIRYSSGHKAEDLSTNQTIDMQGLVYPITVKAEGQDIRVQDISGKLVNTGLKSGEELTIDNSSINKLMVSGTVIPDVYALEQNYPNPFNPSTVIEFSLPEDVNDVRLTIYDVIGQKVAELVNGKLDAGKYKYTWNASNAATGMYIYELRTEKFVSVKKMLLMK